MSFLDEVISFLPAAAGYLLLIIGLVSILIIVGGIIESFF